MDFVRDNLLHSFLAHCEDEPHFSLKREVTGDLLTQRSSHPNSHLYSSNVLYESLGTTRNHLYPKERYLRLFFATAQVFITFIKKLLISYFNATVIVTVLAHPPQAVSHSSIYRSPFFFVISLLIYSTTSVEFITSFRRSKG